MFKEHKFTIWGDYCACGRECFVLQDKFHPWSDTDFTLITKCPGCGEKVIINRSKAEKFYNNRILSYFTNLEGQVMDLGCGGGFLSEFLLGEDNINSIYSIDSDISCMEYIQKLKAVSDRIAFINMDIKDLDKYFKPGQIDYIVSRDVFMFIEDTQKYFDDITSIVSKGIRQMGWYVTNNERMKNSLLPDQIVYELKSRNWEVTMEALDWYKSGYFIKADKRY